MDETLVVQNDLSPDNHLDPAEIAEALLEHDCDRARERALQFPGRGEDWKRVILAYAGEVYQIKESFFEGLFEACLAHLNHTYLEETGRWRKFDVWVMHVFYDAARRLPPDYLEEGRRYIRNLEQRFKAEVPPAVIASFFDRKDNETTLSIVRTKDPRKCDKNNQWRKNRQDKANDNRSRAHGGTGGGGQASTSTKGKKKKRR